MVKKLLAPLRGNQTKHSLYIYQQYIDMFASIDTDILTIGIVNPSTLKELSQFCDGLLLTGGGDIDPSLYHEKLDLATKLIDPTLEKIEFDLIEQFHTLKKPIIGICRGIQSINVAFGGTLIQDIGDNPSHQQALFDCYHHPVTTIKGTLLNKYLGHSFLVNSFHHQAIDTLAPGFSINAYSPDKIIEGIEKDNIIALQWHPEKINDRNQERICQLFKQLLSK